MARAGFFSAAAVGAFSLALSSVAHADMPQPADFTDPNIRQPYSGGSNPIEWAPKYTTDSYAWTEADRSILRQADAERQRLMQDRMEMARQQRARSEELNGFRGLSRISRSTGAPPRRIFARSTKPIRMEPLHFTGKHAGAGLVGHLPQSHTAGTTPTFGRIFSGGSSFSFGGSLQRGASDGKAIRFDFSR